MSAAGAVATPVVHRRGWGKLPFSPLGSPVRRSVTRTIPAPSDSPEAALTSTPSIPALLATDPRGLITAFNPSAEKLLGHDAEDLIGQATPEVFLDPAELASRAIQYRAELREPVAQNFGVLIARARHDLPSEEEWQILRKDGSQVRVLISVTRLRDFHSRTQGYVFAVLPIS